MILKEANQPVQMSESVEPSKAESENAAGVKPLPKRKRQRNRRPKRESQNFVVVDASSQI